VTGSPTRVRFVERPRITLKDLPHVQTSTNLTCDARGNLWITSQAGDTIVRLPAASIEADAPAVHGTPQPDVTLAVPSGGRFNVQGVVVAPDGWVWAVDFDLNRFARISQV
jgi:streptogramin lyase